MPGHTRLYRRGATYYHRAAVPQDIVETYGKREETFSLRTKDKAEALVRVKVEAVRVDSLFTKQRQELGWSQQITPVSTLDELSPDQIARVKQAYLHYLLDEDEDTRLDGFFDPDDAFETLPDLPKPTFEEHQDPVDETDEIARANVARGKRDEFYRSEADAVLAAQAIQHDADLLFR